MPINARAIDELLEQACEQQVLSGAVATVVGADGVLYERAAGRMGVERDDPVAPDTVFRIASMTKALTSVGALQLVESGELELEQPVETVLPRFGDMRVLDGFDGDEPRLRRPARPVTLRHLLTHTSGLSYWFSNAKLLRWYEVTGTPDPLTGRRASLDAPLVCDPGERWEYGMSTDWLGLVVEEVSGQGLDAYLRERVFAPLGMPDATFAVTDAQRPRLMDLHARADDGGLLVSDLQLPEEPEFASGGGGAYATARDYGRFLRALLGGGQLDGERVLRTETVELMLTDHLRGAALPPVMRSAIPELTLDVPGVPFRQGWGLGLHLLEEDVPGMRRAGSADWAGLFNCYFWLDRRAGVGCALMTQLLPFFDPRMVQTLLGFEQRVYAHAGSAAAA